MKHDVKIVNMQSFVVNKFIAAFNHAYYTDGSAEQQNLNSENI